MAETLEDPQSELPLATLPSRDLQKKFRVQGLGFKVYEGPCLMQGRARLLEAKGAEVLRVIP